ncbi:PASTA domain-containing protein, partial [Nocardioides stalactiti]|uniref:PASTA domain-containing protein n=1 Tax=Nocardioides stalactiti TaxID=2755356 RepID=UPI0016024AE7
ALRGAEIAPPPRHAAPAPDSTAVLPRTSDQAVAGVAAVPLEPTPRLDRPVAYQGTPAPQLRKRSPWPAVLLVLLLVAAAVAVVALVLGGEDDTAPTTDDRTTSAPTDPTTPTSETSATDPTTPTTTAPEPIEVVASDYVGRDVADVERELQLLGLQVRLFEDANPGDQAEDTVVSVNPTGTLQEGDTVDVHYWGAAASTAPPTTETPPTSDSTATDTGGTDTTEGG